MATKYRRVVDLFGDDYETFLHQIRDDELPHCVTDTWQRAAQAALSQWDQGDNGELCDHEPWGTNDYVLRLDWIGVDNYVITHNPHYGYVTYTEVIDE